jgi:Tol biopolymer transport system component
MKKFHVYIAIIVITLLSTSYVEAMYLWSVEVKSGQIACEGAGFQLVGGIYYEISPDRKRIIAESSISDVLVVKEIDGTIVRLLPDNYHDVRWANDSRAFVAVANGFKVVINSADENIEEFVLADRTGANLLGGPVWSPDGKWITFYYFERGAKNPYIELMRPDGKEKRSLTNVEGLHPKLAWSPDSKLLAVTPIRGMIQIIDIDSGSVIFTLLADIIENLVSPQWSPKKRQIAYVQRQTSTLTSTLLVTDVDKNETIEVTSLSYIAALRWSPDGAHIAVMCREDSPELDIWIVDIKSKLKRRLTSTGEVVHIVDWSLNGEKIYYLSEKSPFQLPSKEDVTGLLDTAIMLYKSDRYEEAAELVSEAVITSGVVHKVAEPSDYTWEGDFPGLVTQMKELYRDKHYEDFYGASLNADLLLREALERKLARGERVGYLQREPLTIAPSSQEEEKRKFALILDEAKRYYAEGKYDDALLKLAEAYQLLQGKSTLVPKASSEGKLESGIDW